jgi:hypothetical protein
VLAIRFTHPDVAADLTIRVASAAAINFMGDPYAEVLHIAER